MTANRFLSPLALRLAAAFIVVAITAVAILSILTLISARTGVSDLVADVHRHDSNAAAAAAARAYQRAGDWDDADLSSAAAVAAQGQANLVLRDAEGEIVAAPSHEAAEMLGDMHGVEIIDAPRSHPVTAPVVVDGEQVGVIELRFPTSHLPTPERQIRNALTRNIVGGAAIAVLAAIGVAVFVARRVSLPVTALTAAATALGAGRRDVRVDMADAPGELGALAMAFDQMADAVEREDELRRRLVADVAHEVRTPLTILQGTTEALVDGIAEPDQTTLNSLHEEVLRLSRLVADLETLAAADAAVLRLQSEEVDLSQLGSAVVELARPAAEASGLRLRTELTRSIVHGDPQRLRQVLTTLVANALAYTPSGGEIIVSTATKHGEALLRVQDTGPGIDAGDLPRLFDRFYRGTASRGTTGSGIGLAVASELVAAHHGRLEAANRPQGGASFTIHLPALTRQPTSGTGSAHTLMSR